MNLTKYIIATSLLLLIVPSCNLKYANNLYKKYPKGINLSKEILKDAKQFIVVDGTKLIVVDISKDWKKFEPHVMVFDNESKFIGTAYIPSNKIHSVANGEILVRSYDDFNSDRKLYVDDLPKEWKLSELPLIKATKGGLRRGNLLVEEVVWNNNTISLIGKKSNDAFICVGVDKRIMNEEFLSKFTTSDTLNLSTSNFDYDYEKSLIHTRFFASSGKLIDEYYLIKDVAVWGEIFQRALN